MPTKDHTLTCRIDPGLRRRLKQLAAATRRSMSFLATEAIEAFLDQQDWEIEDIKRALKEADRGEFATDAEVRTLFKKYTRHARKVAS